MVSATRSKRKGVAEPAREAAPSSTSCQTKHHVKKRARVALACQRCKFRKQKCDGGQPECTNCINSGYQCEYIIPTKSYPYGKTEYTIALEERIALLESKLSKECLQQLEDEQYDSSSSTPSSRRSSVQSSNSNMVSTATQTDESYFSSESAIFSPVEMKSEPFSLSPTPAPSTPFLSAPHHLHSSSNTMLAGNSCNDPISRSSRASFDGWIWQDNVPSGPVPGVFTNSYDPSGENAYFQMGSGYGMDYMSEQHSVHSTNGVTFGYQDTQGPFWGRHDGCD